MTFYNFSGILTQEERVEDVGGVLYWSCPLATTLLLCHYCPLYFVLHSMYCWRPLAPSRFCNFSRKERKRKHVHLPTPLVSYIFLGLACLKQAGARLLCGCMEPLFLITWTWFWSYKQLQPIPCVTGFQLTWFPPVYYHNDSIIIPGCLKD